MKNLPISVLLALFVVTANSFAANVWTGERHITEVETVSNGGFLITFDSAISSACSNSSGDNRVDVYANQNTVTSDGVKALQATT